MLPHLPLKMWSLKTGGLPKEVLSKGLSNQVILGMWYPKTGASHCITAFFVRMLILMHVHFFENMSYSNQIQVLYWSWPYFVHRKLTKPSVHSWHFFQKMYNINIKYATVKNKIGYIICEGIFFYIYICILSDWPVQVMFDIRH